MELLFRIVSFTYFNVQKELAKIFKKNEKSLNIICVSVQENVLCGCVYRIRFRSLLSGCLFK